MQHDYYKILGVDAQASIEQINKAYRVKAKILHPDVNPDMDAHQQFVLLNEAYEFIKNKKLNYRSESTEAFNNWWKEEKQKANEKAEQQAKMDYKAYINSDEYRYLNSINVLLDHFGFLLTITIPFLLPIMFYNWYGLSALLPASILLLFATPYLIEGWSLRKKINRKRFFLSFKYLLKFDDFKLIWLTLFNAFIFWNYALITMIEFKYIVLIYTISILVCTLLWYYKFKEKINQSLIVIIIGIAPIAASSSFLINFYVSFNKVEETYNFELQRGATIRLENDAYDDFTFIRFFPDPDKIGGSKKIKLNFAQGIYGWRVLKSYELIK